MTFKVKILTFSGIIVGNYYYNENDDENLKISQLE